MDIEAMIDEWRTGCSCMENQNPSTCGACTLALIDAIDRKIKAGEVIILPTEEIQGRRGIRFREETITVRTTWNDVKQIEQLVNAPSGPLQRRVLQTMESQCREGLVSLGWKPPESKR